MKLYIKWYFWERLFRNFLGTSVVEPVFDKFSNKRIYIKPQRCFLGSFSVFAKLLFFKACLHRFLAEHFSALDLITGIFNVWACNICKLVLNKIETQIQGYSTNGKKYDSPPPELFGKGTERFQRSPKIKISFR